MRNIFEDSEKIWEVIDQGKGKDKKQTSPLRMNCGENKNSKENRDKSNLKWLNDRNILEIKKIETYDINDNNRSKNQFNFFVVNH